MKYHHSSAYALFPFVLLWSGHAFAQDGNGSASSQPSNPEDAPIIVTGQKIDRSLQQTTDSVMVITEEELRREPGRDLTDVIDRVANAASTVGERSFAIRGVDQRGVSGRGSTLIIFVDDSPIGNRTSALGPSDLWDLAQVEVFRGPQSTNFGRSALAGGIYVRTKNPGYDWTLDLRAEAGEADALQAAIAGGGPIIDDRLAFRISINHVESDGFITNTFLNEDANPKKLTTGRLKLLFEPSSDLSIISTSTYTDNLTGDRNLSATNGNPGNVVAPQDIVQEVSQDLPGRENSETFIQSVNLAWDIAPDLQMRSISTFQNTDYTRQLDGDNMPVSLSFADRTGNEEIITQELRLAYASEKWTGVVGGYLYDLSEHQTDDFVIPFFFFIPGIPQDVRLARDSDFFIDTTNIAAFAEAEIVLGRKLDLILGLRYDYEELATSSIAVSTSLEPLAPQFAFLGAFLGTETERITASYDAWLPKLGVRWNLSEDANLSFVIQRAFQAGGGTFDVIDGTVSEFDPEFLWNFEIGLRTLWLDGRLRFNANVYYADWTDQQVQEPRPDFPFVFTVTNAGESTLYGFEADVSFDVTADLEVYGALGYAHTEFDSFPNARFNPWLPVSDANLPNFDGNRFPFSPRWSANLGVAYEPGEGIFGGFDANFRSSQFRSSANLAINRCCQRTIVNARLGYAWEEFRLSLQARNLFDDDHYTFLTAAFLGGEAANVGDPQTFSVRLDARF